MASRTATRELAEPLPPTAVPAPSLGGRLRVVGLRLAGLAHRSALGRYGWPLLVLSFGVAAYVLAAVAHELLVGLFALVLPIVTGIPVLQDLLAALPVNFVYAAAILRYAGQIDLSGFAVTGDAGVWLASRWPNVFYDPSFVAGEGLISAVFGPGSSLLARMLASTLANLSLLAAGLLVSYRAVAETGLRRLADLRGARLLVLLAGLAVQVEVGARVLRTPGGSRDLETLGVVPFMLHQVLRLHREVYDLVMFQLSRFLDPVFGQAVLIGLVGLLAGAYVAVRAVRLATRWALARRRGEPFARGPFWSAPRKLVAEVALVGMLASTLPPLDLLTSESRFLEMDGRAGFELAQLAPGPATDVPEVPVAPVEPAAPSVEAAPAIAAPPVASAVPAPKPAAPPRTGPSVVAVGGRAGTYTYSVNGVPTEFKGMGYNVTHAGLPAAERKVRLARDFATMRDAGVNHVVGWRTAEWDEAVLDAAHAHGIGVVMPFDLDDKLDYSDQAVRWRVRAEVMQWVARYRNHPAIRMWGIGNESLLHLKVTARARAFADFYAQLVDLVRQYDPDHPVMYREAEDVYVKWLREAWAPRGGPPHGFVLGMNFYTFRMKDALADWPSKNWDVPLVISEFAPAGIGRGERAAGYWRMWGIVRQRPELVLGAAPYVWNVEGPEPVDRLFGLTQDAAPVDSTLQTLREMYSQPLPPKDLALPVTVPGLLGMPEPAAREILAGLGLELGGVIYQPASEPAGSASGRRFGVGSVISQEPAPGRAVAPGAVVRIAVVASLGKPEVRYRPIPD